MFKILTKTDWAIKRKIPRIPKNKEKTLIINHKYYIIFTIIKQFSNWEILNEENLINQNHTKKKRGIFFYFLKHE